MTSVVADAASFRAFSFAKRLPSLSHSHFSTHRQAQEESTRKKTIYTIDYCPPTDPHKLTSLVQRHKDSLDEYLRQKPIARHTQHAFDSLESVLKSDQPLILDSGCGTGRSSIVIGDLYPDHTIIGVDRSLQRLARQPTAEFQKGIVVSEPVPSRPNVFLVRADLIDFWRLLVENNVAIERHYMLYPDPHPAWRRLKNRFYAHPIFPLLLHVSRDLCVRSNWKLYLEEFSAATQLLDSSLSCTLSPREPTNNEQPWTLFERKYWSVQEPTFELKISGNSLD